MSRRGIVLACLLALACPAGAETGNGGFKIQDSGLGKKDDGFKIQDSGLGKTESGWGTATLPGPTPAAGDGWYRAWLKPAPSFFSKHDRNLFAESVVLNLRGVADAHEVFVNGTRIGGGGAWPPESRSGRAENHRHKIAPGLLLQDQYNEILLHVRNAPGGPARVEEAPFVMNYFDECALEGEWEFRADPPTPGGARKDRPPRAAFDRYHESHRVLGEAVELVRGPKRTPAETLAAMSPAPGLAADLLLAEPLVAQPTHMSYDERGRLWVSQYRQYPYPAGLKPLSRDKFYRTQYDRIPPAPPHHDRGRDRVSIHADTDGDGTYDRHTVFQDGLNMANAAQRGWGGVWVMHTPHLLFYPDADFDDVPDGPPVVHLKGFGLEDSHSVANGLVWGMDGWLYGAQGSTTSSRVLRPGVDDDKAPGVFFEGCMIWRYHPRTRAYEIFAEGGGNTFGLEIDDAGRLYSGHNGGGTHGWNFLPGGIYSKQGWEPGKIGPPHRPYTFGEMPTLRTADPIPRFTHHYALVGGTAFGPDWQGRLLAVDPLHSMVKVSQVSPSGSALQTRGLEPALRCADEGFRPVFIANAPDGSLHIADFYEHYIAHGQHYQGQLDPDTGRIFRLRDASRPLEKPVDLTSKTPVEWIGLLDHPNRWHRHTAVRLLGERRDPETRPLLRQRLAAPAALPARGALWALHLAEWLDASALATALDHPDPVTRAWAIRLAADAGSLEPTVAERLRRLAAGEPDAETRAHLATALRRLPAAQARPLLDALLRRGEDAADSQLPHLLWWAMEKAVTEDRAATLAWFIAAGLWEQPLVLDHALSRLMRRLAEQGREADLLDAARLLRAAPGAAPRAKLMEGFEAAFQSRSLAGAPEELVEAIAAAGHLSLPLRLRRHDPAAVPEALTRLADAKAPAAERVSLARCLGELAVTNAVPALLDLGTGAADPALRQAALSALGAFADPAIGARLTRDWAGLPPSARRAAAGVLATRAAWIRPLLAAVEAGGIPPADLPAEIRAGLRAHADPELAALATRLLPVAAAAPGETRIEAIQTALGAGTGNPYSGETLFMERCAGCHQLFKKGGNLGPDLTRYQRDDLGTMLVSIVTPNAEIREGYQFMTLATRDGRTVSGFLVERDARRVVLRGMDGADLALEQSAVASLEPVGRSLMPEGLLDDLDDQRLRDLFAFLRSSQPISK